MVEIKTGDKFINSVKTKLDDLIYILQKENPNASWKNLVTGVAILVLVVVFSVWYFNNSQDDISNNSGLDVTLDGGAVQGDAVALSNVETVEVMKGEGLWHVAKRVCGDGEKYKYLAKENNLHIHRTRLAVGQELKVNCGD